MKFNDQTAVEERLVTDVVPLLGDANAERALMKFREVLLQSYDIATGMNLLDACKA